MIARSANAPQAYIQTSVVKPDSVSGDFTVPHYIRFVVRDQPGIVAKNRRGANFVERRLPEDVQLRPDRGDQLVHCGGDRLRPRPDAVDLAQDLAERQQMFDMRRLSRRTRTVVVHTLVARVNASAPPTFRTWSSGPSCSPGRTGPRRPPSASWM